MITHSSIPIMITFQRLISLTRGDILKLYLSIISILEIASCLYPFVPILLSNNISMSAFVGKYAGTYITISYASFYIHTCTFIYLLNVHIAALVTTN